MVNDHTTANGGGLSRRTALKTAGLATALGTLEMVGRGHKVPIRLATSASGIERAPGMRFS